MKESKLRQDAGVTELPGWQFATMAESVSADKPVEAVIGDNIIIIVEREAGFAAFQGFCPHAWARLSEGRIEAGWLHCPQHLAKFCLKDGSCGPGWQLPPLKEYPTRVHDACVLVPYPLRSAKS
tara:strand:+ start:729 stop:1100 length:372 start_codon:yes stop_codon:yes gene_type:complete